MKKVLFIPILVFLITPLFSQDIYGAIYSGNYEEVKKLLDSGESPNAFNNNFVIKEDKTKVFSRNKTGKDFKKIFMEYAQDKIFQDSSGLYSLAVDDVFEVKSNLFQYPLFAAIVTQNYDIAELLIDRGAYININNIFPVADTGKVVNRYNYYIQAAGLKYYFKSEGCYLFTRDFKYIYHSPLSLLYSYLYADKGNKSVIQKLINKVIDKGADPGYPNSSGFKKKYLNERFFLFNMLGLAVLEKDFANVKLLVDNNHYINTYPFQSFTEKKKKYRIFPASSLTELAEKFSSPEIAEYLKEKGGIKLPADYYPKNAFARNYNSNNKDQYLPTSKTDILCMYREYAYSKFVQKYAYYFDKYGRNPYEPNLIYRLLKRESYKSAMFVLKKLKMITPRDMVLIINSGQQDLIDEALKHFDAPHALTYFKTGDNFVLKEENHNSKYTSVYLESLIHNKRELSEKLLEMDKNTGLDSNYLLSCLSYSTLMKDPDPVSLFLEKTDKASISNAFNIYGRSGPGLSEDEEKELYDTGSGSDYKKNETVNSPFLFALKYSSPEVLKLFIDKGADVNREFEFFNAASSIKGEYNAKKKKYKPYSKDKLKEFKKQKKYEKFTPLLYYTAVVKDEDPAVVKLLVDNGADVNFKSPFLNETAVFHAQNYETIKIFCDNKADLNVFNLNRPRYPTVLWKRASSYAAAQPDYEKILTLLIKSGADKKIKAYNEYSSKSKFFTLSNYATKEKLDTLKTVLKQ